MRVPASLRLVIVAALLAGGLASCDLKLGPEPWEVAVCEVEVRPDREVRVRGGTR